MRHILLIISTVLCLFSIQNYYSEPKEPATKVEVKDSQNNYESRTISNLAKSFSNWKKVKSYKYSSYYEGVTSSSYYEKGITNGELQKLTILGKKLSVNGLKYGMNYNKITKKFKLSNKITAVSKNQKISVELDNKMLKTRPLIYKSPYFYELHYDAIKDKLIGVTMYTFDGFLLEKSYPFTYWGTDKLVKKEIPITNTYSNVLEKQVFNATKVVRNLYGVGALSNQKSIENVAYKHSVDMFKRDYFAHVSPTKEDLASRLKRGKVSYSFAGENLAYNYDDSVKTVIGWLNSEGHRKNLLNETFKKMGIGVYGPYITQNLVK